MHFVRIIVKKFSLLVELDNECIEEIMLDDEIDVAAKDQ